MTSEVGWPWGRAATPGELAKVADAAAEYRAVWETMRVPPWPAAFDGTSTDVRSLDYLQYEGFRDPPCGLEGAALVCGEVLRRAAGARWVISHQADWFVASEPSDPAQVLVCPLGRLWELAYAGVPQHGRHRLWLLRTVIDWVGLLPTGTAERVCDLVDADDEYLPDIEAAIVIVRDLGNRSG